MASRWSSCQSGKMAPARASFATDQAHLAINKPHAWKENAIAVAAGLGKSQVDWLDAKETESVERVQHVACHTAVVA